MHNTIIDIFENSQNKYLEQKDRNYLKNTSQFFTPYNTASKMISTIDFSLFQNNNALYILEPSAGCGILIASLVIYILDNHKHIRRIHIDSYEYDPNVFNILCCNLKVLNLYIKEVYNIDFSYNTIHGNFITKNKTAWLYEDENPKYDIIISNPPYKKINQTSDESIIMENIIYGQPNIYTLFIAMSLKLLKPNGIYTVLSPRNYLSGEYSKKLRKFIFSNYSLTHIHSFDKRSMFKSVNQEVIISTFKNNREIEDVSISFNGFDSFLINFKNLVFDNDSLSILIPKKLEDILFFDNMKKLDYTLENLGLKISVGPIVQFRNEPDISRYIYYDNYAPLLISADIQNNNIIKYFERENKRKTHNKSISSKNKYLIKNSNYLLIRKITAKDDIDLVVSCILDKNYFKHDYLGLDNNLLYIHNIDKSEMSLELCYGLYCFINSKQFKTLYFMINGTHTINVSDFNNIKFPSLSVLCEIGKNLMKTKIFTEDECTKLIYKYI
ncbi:Eco57I restriction-modification methylase domain-containing protein [Terrisporobacter vanillatitrophus]|uniref:Eco57I restriction-modification methylase domain-containing protein n=1 Tax=Terrisporobacter vanillatitrophus TaxID=3058402 RepID=UPI0033660284